MRLKDLVQNIPDQVFKINEVINDKTRFVECVGEEDKANWATFRGSVWGNPLALGFEWQREVDTVTLDASGGVDAQQEVQMGIDADVKAEGYDRPPSKDAPANIMDLPGSLPDVWGLQSQKILVRAEYEQAEQAALKANDSNYDAFLVGGQAGIGLPIPCPCPQILILSQEKQSFCFGSSSGALRLGSLPHYRFSPMKQCFSTKVEQPFFKTSQIAVPIWG